MRGHLVIQHAAADARRAAVSVTPDPDGKTIAAARDGEALFWLDLAGDDAQVPTLLADTFGFHQLATEGAEDFGRRATIETYDDFTLVVVYGLGDDGDPVEVRCFYTDHFLVTHHRGALGALDVAAGRLQSRHTSVGGATMLLYTVLDALVDGYFPALADMDDTLDALEDDILRKPTDEQLAQLFALKRRLVTLRRFVVEERDMIAAALFGDERGLGISETSEHYYRNLYDHLARTSQTADSYRDLVASALDMHLSTTSNRLNVVMKQLAIIATVFLPLSFLTGFFGQNFGWMVNRLGSPAVFWACGVVLQLAVAIGLVIMFRRKGWIGDGTPG